MGCPDAFRDISDLLRRHQPAAVLDVGSHVGRTIARILEDHSIPIHGFEPTPGVVEKLTARFAKNPLVMIHPLALSNRSGMAKFYCNANEQTNSLLDNDCGNRNELSEQTEHLKMCTVPTTTLDSWVEQNIPQGNIFIKSDIQGAEGQLLEGGKLVFCSRVIGFYSEVQITSNYLKQTNFFALHETLSKDFGFVLYNIYPCLHDSAGRAVQTDALWIHERCLSCTSNSE